MRKPKLNLPVLREIGWQLWDPIGLSYENWKGQPFEDEYDTYLAKVAQMLRAKEDEDEIVSYLFRVESEHIGVGTQQLTPAIEENLRTLVRTIKAEPNIWIEQETP